MSSKSIKKFSAGVMVLVIMACFIPVTAGAFAPGEGRPDRGFGKKGHCRSALGFWQNPQMVQDLKLTETQIEKIREADFTFREKQLALKAQIDSLHLKMDKAFSAETMDEKAVIALAEKMSDIKGKLFVQRIESRMMLGKLLDADQIQKLKLYDRHPNKQGRGKGGKHLSSRNAGSRPCDNQRF